MLLQTQIFNNVVTLTSPKFIDGKKNGIITYLGSKRIFKTTTPSPEPSGNIIISDDNVIRIIENK